MPLTSREQDALAAIKAATETSPGRVGAQGGGEHGAVLEGAVTGAPAPARQALAETCECGHPLDEHTIEGDCMSNAPGSIFSCTCPGFMLADETSAPAVAEEGERGGEAMASAAPALTEPLVELIDDVWFESCGAQDERTPGRLAVDVVLDPANRDVVLAALDEVIGVAGER